MIFAALSFALSIAVPVEPAAPVLPWAGGRVYTSERVHAGLRPALLATNDGPERGIGLTAQITWRTPW